ncbi:uncharacterized protein LOC135371209 [Ornithodoros turicata]|uniref:uncharacterized protein LOC135371209 n=1 Tax=Ornithodoros turicata TaxID=34597 RepID=UPI003139908F
MDLEEAQTKFSDLLGEIHPGSVAEFLLWIQHRHFVATCSGHQVAEAVHKLNQIAQFVRKLVPEDAVLKSENILWPTQGENADCHPETTVHVDAFLYDDDDIDDLVEQGKLHRSYCGACGSRDIVPLTFISHSASRNRVEFVFRQLVPYLKDKSVLDVGSRLGAFLYAAHAFTPADPIVGVEVNADFCALQEKVIREWNMEDRVRVVNADVREIPEVVAASDVVILNNVFDFFASQEEQVVLWQYLKQHIKRGAVLVTAPSLHKSLEHLNTGIVVEEWVQERYVTDPLAYSFMKDHEELSDICAYDVL